MQSPPVAPSQLRILLRATRRGRLRVAVASEGEFHTWAIPAKRMDRRATRSTPLLFTGGRFPYSSQSVSVYELRPAGGWCNIKGRATGESLVKQTEKTYGCTACPYCRTAPQGGFFMASGGSERNDQYIRILWAMIKWIGNLPRWAETVGESLNHTRLRSSPYFYSGGATPRSARQKTEKSPALWA